MRFTLRDLFWVTLLVATALGWSANYARYERRLFARGRHAEALRRELERAEHYEQVYIDRLAKATGSEGGAILDNELVSVDWELVRREIP